MRTHICGLLFASALLLTPGVARAQRVVVLEIEGDRGNRMREQVETALRKAGKVELVSIKRYKEGAARKHLRGLKGMTPTAVAQVSRLVPFEAAVGGSVSDTFSVHILDASGQELWTKDLPVRGTLLSSDNARRLAKAIAAAALTAAPARGAEPSEESGTDNSKPPEVSVESDAPTIKTPARVKTTMPGLDVTNDESGETHTDAAPSPGVDADLESESHRKAPRVTPKLIHVQLAGTTTWRSYCSRPGVTSCHAYDALPDAQKPAGDTVDFSPQVPYAGLGVTAFAFPLQSFETLAKGLGLEGSYSRGFSLTNVQVQTTGGNTQGKQVISIDEAFDIMVLARYYFAFGGDKKDPLLGFGGLRGGFMSRTFEVDPTANVPLPGSHRRYPAIGADGTFPLAKLVRVEATLMYFINPAPGIDEIAGYGQSASGKGFGLEAGLSGDIWGPFGYVLRFKYTTYQDQFVGAGNKWGNGGAAQEAYSGLYWGATAQF